LRKKVVDLAAAREERARQRGRPAKSLVDHVRDGTFRARRDAHRDLLVEDDEVKRLPWRELRALARRYRHAKREETRRKIAVEFERAAQATSAEEESSAPADLNAVLAGLGKRGSAEQVINFFPRFFRHEDDAPFVLDPWQQDFIREAYRRDRQGRRIYKEILLGIPRGNGKTPLATGLSLHALLTAPGRPKVYQAAGSKKQASLGIGFATDWIEDERAELGQWLRSKRWSIQRRDGRGIYEVMSSEGKLGHGGKPTVGIVDEWWLFKTDAETQTYVAIETALHKLQHSFLLAISTAGYDKSSQLGQAYESALKLPDVEIRRDGFLTIARDVDAGRLMWWYGLPDGLEIDLDDDQVVLEALRLANPGSWVDHRELLRALRRTRDVLEWMRLNLNAWTKTKGTWLPAGKWRSLAAKTKKDSEIPAGAEIYVAVDAAHSYDTTAVAWAWVRPDGRVFVDAHVWSVRDDAPADEHLDDDELDNEELVEPFIRQLGRRFKIKEIVYDPNYFGTEGRHLGEQFLVAEMFPQSKAMTASVQEFYRAATGGRLVHNGNKVLTAHVEGTAGRKNEDGYWKIKKLRQVGTAMDACTAAVMAVGRALRAGEKVDKKPAKPRVFWVPTAE
jgi:phage terminase large subunit-like protein